MKVHGLDKHKGSFFEVLETTSNSQIAVMTIEPGGTSGSEGLHPGDQVVVILEGEAEVRIENKSVNVSAHEVVIIPAKKKHLIVNNSKKDVFLLNIYAPPAY